MSSIMSSILCVDDDLGLLSSLERMLTQDGHAVLTASSVPKSLEILRTNRVDLMFMDTCVQGVSGLEAWNGPDPSGWICP